MDRKPLVTYSVPSKQVQAQAISDVLRKRHRMQYGALYPEQKRRMEAAGCWVENRIIDKVCAETGIARADYDQFLQGSETLYGQLKPILLAHIGKEQADSLARKLDKRERCRDKGPEWPAAGLHEKVLEHWYSRELEGESTWKRFRSGETAPKQETLDAIGRMLSLTEEERDELKLLVRKDVIPDCDLEDMHDLTADYWEVWLDEHRSVWRDVGEDRETAYQTAREVFEADADVPAHVMQVLLGESCGNISQGALLKVDIGFCLDRDEAPDYMAAGKTGFYSRRDFLFLAFMYMGFYDVEEIRKILDEYKQEQDFENPYSDLGRKFNRQLDPELVIGKTYTRAELEALLAVSGNQSIKRKLDSRRYQYTLSGKGSDASFAILGRAPKGKK